jgi:LPXTG-site transpeptidase (sortase) family protein
MDGTSRISLDNPVLISRLKGTYSPNTYKKRTPVSERRTVHDVLPATINITKKVNGSSWETNSKQQKIKLKIIDPNKILYKPEVKNETAIEPMVEVSPIVHLGDPVNKNQNLKKRRRILRLDNLFVVLAVILFMGGLFIAYDGIKSDHISQVQAQKLTKEANTAFNPNKDTNAVSTVKPTASAVSSYTVPANNPKIIKIPKLGVDSRILNVGTDKTGALKTPNNVFDTAWYNQSALPGQPGAVLIDGHISSWTSKGVFYGLNKLVPGDTITITTGNDTVYSYQVVQTKTYSANDVDMTAAISPVVSGTPGLNLISCYGQVEPGTSEFNQRIIVFTKQISS